MSESKEQLAEAASKLADAGSQVVDFLLKVVAAPAGQLAGIADDWLGYFRYKNLLVIRDKVEALHEAKGLRGKQLPLPPKFALPIVEAASLEEEEPLQNLWAHLIANATDPKHQEQIHPAFAGVIRELSADEALIAVHMATLPDFPLVVASRRRSTTSWFGHSGGPGLDGLYERFEKLCLTLPLRQRHSSAAYLTNLERLGLIEISFDVKQTLRENSLRRLVRGASHPFLGGDDLELESTREDYVRVTKFGENFLSACGLYDARQRSAHAAEPRR